MISDGDYDELITTSEAGRMLRVSRETIVRYCEQGQFTLIRTPGGHRRIRKVEVQAILEGNGQETSWSPRL